jgi:rhodanese-related sulfurtransferase
MHTIDTPELKQKLGRDEDFLFLNVLPENYFNEEHIPGSESLPFEDEDFLEKVSRKAPDKDTEIVVYCASMECPLSTKAVKKLEATGYKNVADYEGGMEAWKKAETGIRQ